MRVLVECEAGAGIVKVLEHNGYTCDYSYLGEYGLAAAAAERHDYDIIVLSKNLFQEIVRRTKEYAAPPINVGKLRIDTSRRAVMVDDKIVRLTGTEYNLMELLATSSGEILKREVIFSYLYAENTNRNEKIIDVFVCHIRKKLANATGGKHYIETIRGQGYRLINRESTHDQNTGLSTEGTRAACAPLQA